jgi:DMSO/TMAO reductase YedYZ molybdopterin-dependent catalytic subunit
MGGNTTMHLFFIRKNLLLFLLIAFVLLFFQVENHASQKTISVHGAVKKSLNLSIKDIRSFPEFHINAVPVLKEKQDPSKDEELIEVADYAGVLLRDVLEKAGMKYKRKFEPAVYIRVLGAENEEVVFSFGEIFYSCIGRSTLLAYRKNGKIFSSRENRLALIVSNDIRNGRQIPSVSEIIVERTDIEMKVYEERKKNIIRPPTSSFEIMDKRTRQTHTVTMENFIGLPLMQIRNKVQVGDCEGFHGVYSYEGIPLPALLEKLQVIEFPRQYDRYIAVSSENGFCATFSIGELFNSRLENNIIIAFKKGGQSLGPEEAFAMMVVPEDNTGGRSVKRISHMYIY